MGVRGELFSIVVSDCFDLVSERQEHACAGLHDRVRVLVRQFGELGVFGGSLDVRHDNAFVIGADNRVGLPVSDAAFCGDNRRPLIDIDAVRNQPAPRILALAPVVFFAAVTQVKIQRAPVFLVFPDMLIDALVTDKGDAILRQTPADLIGTPLLLRQFFFDQLHQIWRHFARLVRGLLASLRGLLVRLLEAIAARAGVANKLAADRRRIDANLPRDVGLRVAALQERVNLAALFAGQMEIAFGHFSSVRCAVPRKDSLPSDRQKNRHTQHGKVWREKTSASRVLAALASSPATKALDPNPFPRHSLRHAVYAALLHFGFETARRFLETLHDLCWLNGLGWVVPDAAGRVLDRSLIDKTVGTPERLVFEGPPVLEAPLEQDKDKRRPIPTTGMTLDTKKSCPPLSVKERATLAKRMVKAAEAIAPELKKARDLFIKRQTARLLERGLTNDEARRVLDSQLKNVLLPDWELEFDDSALAGVTVADVLSDPERFVGQTLADPIEGVAYGRGKAKVLERADGSLWIHSYAHGETNYELKAEVGEPKADGKQAIHVVGGQIAQQIDEAQDALIASGVQIFVRGDRLVEPITAKVKAAGGHETTITKFVSLSAENTTYILNKHAAIFLRYDPRRKEDVEIDPPRSVVDGVLALKNWRFPRVAGVVSTPTLRPDGSVLSERGYDEATQLWCDADVKMPAIAEKSDPCSGGSGAHII